MHNLVEGTVQCEIRFILFHYIKSQEFTLTELTEAICNFDFAYSEVGDKSGPLHKSVFNGKEKCKLKYNAAEARLFLRGISFLLLKKVYSRSEYYKILIEIINICNIDFAPVISQNTSAGLSHLIENTYETFQKPFP